MVQLPTVIESLGNEKIKKKSPKLFQLPSLLSVICILIEKENMELSTCQNVEVSLSMAANFEMMIYL